MQECPQLTSYSGGSTISHGEGREFSELNFTDRGDAVWAPGYAENVHFNSVGGGGMPLDPLMS